MNLESTTDEELLALFASSKNEAYFNELHRRYRTDLITYVERVNPLGDYATAEDIVQQAFMNVHLNHESFDPAMKFRPWLFSIAANFTVNHKKSARRRATSSLNRTETGLRTGRHNSRFDPQDYREEQPNDQTEATERASELRTLVDMLPPPDREVMERLYYQGMTNEEAAADLGIPKGTLKTRLHRSLLFLRCRTRDVQVFEAA